MGIRKFFRSKKSKADKSSQEVNRRQVNRSDSSTSVDSQLSSSSTSSVISFSQKIEVKEIAPLLALTDRPEDLWYQEEEYGEIRTRNCLLAKYAERSDNDEAQPKKKFCTRGLEWMMAGSTSQKDEARMFVLTAQKMNIDNEGMALMYQTVSKGSALLARERASNDAKAIELYLSK